MRLIYMVNLMRRTTVGANWMKIHSNNNNNDSNETRGKSLTTTPPILFRLVCCMRTCFQCFHIENRAFDDFIWLTAQKFIWNTVSRTKTVTTIINSFSRSCFTSSSWNFELNYKRKVWKIYNNPNNSNNNKRKWKRKHSDATRTCVLLKEKNVSLFQSKQQAFNINEKAKREKPLYILSLSSLIIKNVL